ncbi:hypothetical protein D9758_009382 [Tetrapyrgos nigripes]|uniref:Uncharacterized protein n=1 Tax=Tetrapyrgos nigripes TaxID=182062 RepID=A0A8H5FX78_9AGAR|nr:hypothetical protein D9758_009382 [Tetrapyrgos nigripes]
MFSTGRKDSAEYVPLATHQDGGSSEDVDPNLQNPVSGPPPKGRLSPFIIWTSAIVALLSFVNLILIPNTILHYQLSEEDLAKLPYPDLHIGFNRIDKLLHDTLPRPYIRTWPLQIARINQGIKDTVYGNSQEVFISVKDSTLMRFVVPKGSTDQLCAFGWKGPVETRKQDLTTKGDISEIEVWSIISPMVGSPGTVDNLDFDNVSWNNRPVRGELLGTMDLKNDLVNATTENFACPSQDKHLVVEFRCVRVDCQVSFSQIKDVHPNMGFELLRQIP